MLFIISFFSSALVSFLIIYFFERNRLRKKPHMHEWKIKDLDRIRAYSKDGRQWTEYVPTYCAKCKEVSGFPEINYRIAKLWQ